MKDELKKAITTLANKSAESDKPGEAMQLAQAALNLAHVVATLKNADQLSQ